MSKLGKILLMAALVGALVAVGAGIALILKYNDTKTNLAQTQQAKASSDKAAAQAKQDALAAQQAKADTDTKLTAASAQVDDLNTQLTAAKAQASTAQGALDTANAAAKDAQDKLTAIQAAFGGKTPEQVKAEEDKALADVAAAQSEQKILQDQLQSSQAQIDELKKDINNSKIGYVPPGVSGKVTFVNRTWNFVVLDVGLSNGIVPNGELIVYRGRSFLGKVRITKADPNDAVAEILPDIKGDIQVGDSVLN